jgi:hypothetical protein
VHRPVDTHNPIPIRRQLTEPHKHVTEGGSAPRNQALPRRELVGFLGISPNTRVHAIEDLKRSGYRPLLPLTAAAPSSIPVPPGPGRHGGPYVVRTASVNVLGKPPWADQEGVSARGAPRQRADTGP